MKWIQIFKDLETANRAIPAGTSKLVKIGEHRICLSHVEGSFYAIQDCCPHSGHSLSQGKLNYLHEVVCPLHGYRFSIKSGREGDQKCGDARTYQLRADEEGLSIYL